MTEESFLVVGAHPDDAMLGVGGYLARLADLGHRTTVLTLSSGELAGDPERREAEDRAAAAKVGAAIEFAHLPDGFMTDKAIVDVVAACARRVGATTIFAHEPNDRHQDHRQAGLATRAAGRDVPALLFYEGPSTIAFEPTATADISRTWQTKLDALAMYESQIYDRNLLSWVESAARFRAWPRHAGAFCESFRVGHAALCPVESPARLRAGQDRASGLVAAT